MRRIVLRGLRISIFLYQSWRWGRPSPCRFVPSCSTYALEALDAHGIRTGLWLTTKRLFRCAPWGGWGSDAVPLHVSKLGMNK